MDAVSRVKAEDAGNRVFVRASGCLDLQIEGINTNYILVSVRSRQKMDIITNIWRDS